MVVAAILFGVLFQVYASITQISLRVRFQKELWVKSVQMQTMLQNIIDTSRLDYENLKQEEWLPTWWTRSVPLLAVQSATWSSLSINWSWELLYTTMSWWVEQTVSLLWENITLKNAYFIVSPMRDPDTSLPVNPTMDDIRQSFLGIQQPWVFLVGSLVPVHMPTMEASVQTFYTLMQK